MKMKMKYYNQVTKVTVCDGKVSTVFNHTEITEVPCIETKPHVELLTTKRRVLIGHIQPKLITYKEV